MEPNQDKSLNTFNELLNNPLWTFMWDEVAGLNNQVAELKANQKYLHRQVDNAQRQMHETEMRLDAMVAVVDRMCNYYPTQSTEVIQEIVATRNYLTDDLDRLLLDMDTEEEDDGTNWFDELFEV